MNCNKCGSPLPSEGTICPFCGTMMDSTQINLQKNEKDKTFNPNLKSDRFGVDKTNIYHEESKNENKSLGLAIIIGVVLFIIILAIIINVAG